MLSKGLKMTTIFLLISPIAVGVSEDTLGVLALNEKLGNTVMAK